MAGRQRPWVRILRAGFAGSVRLLCFPHSGGSAAFFRSWAGELPPDVELAAVQYPGREDRFAEPPAAGLSEMGRQVCREILRTDTRPLALFGHSLGGLVAYETAIALRDHGREPVLLLVSGSLPPAEAGGGRTHLLSDDLLWSELLAVGGSTVAASGPALDPELRALLLQVARADIRLNERYRPDLDRAALHCAVHCYTGEDDPLVPLPALDGWVAVTDGPFSARPRPGDHFHLTSDTPSLVHDVARRCAGACRIATGLVPRTATRTTRSVL